ncbi:BadF/BadG/BcrA/BcrD ATPase family protein [Catenulispora yoronensis]|uniref:BadF/BadG/BcrA/BcrD ATPase family protein n=2 Tax=Catenulispora yoronensis TaxID=450799 RepID=A0ABN2U0N3_9ACTN
MIDSMDALLPDAVAGIDVGGTKTHLALSAGGRILREAVVPTPQWRTGRPQLDGPALAGLVTERLGRAAAAVPLGVGAHGCDSTEQCAALASSIAAHRSGPVRVVNDAELMPWALGTPGIGVVSGTGAIAVARDEDGRLVRSGGWGWVLGDEGGAAALTREAVRAVLDALDRHETADPLVPAMLAAFGIADPADLAMAVTRGSTAESWGRHAPVVFAAADAGSPLAAAVVEQAAVDLADCVRRLLDLDVPADRVVAGGSVITAQPRLRDRFVAELNRSHPDLAVAILDRPPVAGALALAAAALEGN